MEAYLELGEAQNPIVGGDFSTAVEILSSCQNEGGGALNKSSIVQLLVVAN